MEAVVVVVRFIDSFYFVVGGCYVYFNIRYIIHDVIIICLIRM